jgi:hypothetical protein
MNAEVETQKVEMITAPPQPAKPNNPTAVRKAVALGKEMRKVPDASKADVARRMFETIADEPREIIVQAFVDGAGLTPKGAQTYFYNCRRKVKKSD